MRWKKLFFSFIWGIYISLTLHVSIHFPPIASDMPLATNIATWPTNKVSIFFNYIRIALDIGYGIEQSLIAVLLALFIYRILNDIRRCSYIHKTSLYFLSILFGCVNVAGLCMYWLDCLPMFYSVAWLIGSILLALGWASVFFISACMFFIILDKEIMFSAEKKIEGTFSHFCKKIEDHFFLFSFCIIIGAWIPWIITYYPGSMDNDVFNQLYSYYYVHSNHHPWFSSCVLGGCYDIGKKIGNENIGVFIYVICRDIIMALIYAKCIVLLKEAHFKRIFYYIALLFYAITPVWGAYSKHAFKDTFSAGLFTLYILSLIMILQQVSKKALTLKLCLCHGMAALLASLFRHNCIYVVAPTAIILAIILLKKRFMRQTCIVVTCILVYFIYNYFIINVQGVIPSETGEALSICFQQTARTVKYRGEELTEQEIEGISGEFPYDKLGAAYNPILSDPVKWIVLPSEMRKTTNYIKTWAKMFFRYPVTYIEAAIGQSYGYYAFTPNLPEMSGNWNSGMTIFDWIGGEHDEYFQVHYIEKFRGLREILHAWSKVWNKIPILCLTDICAIYTWSIVLILYYLLEKDVSY